MKRRAAAIIVALCAIGLMVMPGVVGAPRLLLWNSSASVPIGLYRVLPPRALHVGDVVVVMPPDPLAATLAARGSLPSGVPLIKPIAALDGQTICRHGLRITIDGAVVGTALGHDHRGRPLAVWTGCRTLGPTDVYLMNPAEPDSFDGRYFGPLPVSSVIGRAAPLWLPKEH
jgi:conjugative transfer signal peptidase TraF